jgi:DNA-binding SARP family transcriptional activator
MSVTHMSAPTARQTGQDQIRIHCFGHFEVQRNGRIVNDWRRDKAKVLLKQLVAHNGSIKRDVLADLLWPDAEAEQALRNLRVALHALRRAIECGENRDETPVILTRGDTFHLNPLATVWVDTQEFRRLYAAADAEWRRGRIEESVRLYADAEQLYRDDYLVDDLYEQWTFLPREQLKDKYLLVLTRLADAALLEHDYEGCIAYSHKMLARDETREDAYQHLMRCHAIMGRPARALRWFELCREALGRELNVAPSDATRRLAKRIAAGDDLERADLRSVYPEQPHGGGREPLAWPGHGNSDKPSRTIAAVSAGARR